MRGVDRLPLLWLLASNVANTWFASALKISRQGGPVQALGLEQRLHDVSNASDCGLDPRLLSACVESIYQNSGGCCAVGCGCWRKVWGHKVDLVVQAVIFQDVHDRCLLGFSGQINGEKKWKNNPVAYIADHDGFAYREVCQHKVMRGFATSAEKFFTSAGWANGAKFLSSGRCPHGVAVTGTSLGAAVAELLAGCANRGLLHELQGGLLPAFHVQHLTTFGSPPSALSPIDNALRSDRCFPGHRVFRCSNTSSVGNSDLVAFSTAFQGFVHPRQSALQLIELPDGSYDVQVHPCEDLSTTGTPSWTDIQPYLMRQREKHGLLTFVGETLRQIEDNHLIAYYNDSLNKVSPGKLEHLQFSIISKVHEGGHELHTSSSQAMNVTELDSQTKELFLNVSAMVAAER